MIFLEREREKRKKREKNKNLSTQKPTPNKSLFFSLDVVFEFSFFLDFLRFFSVCESEISKTL